MKVSITVPPNVVKILRRLRRFDYQAFLVGGCVRDHLLKVTPRDWDIATDATPEEIRELFDNSRTVGKRFPIVHICFAGGEVIEVTTFRSGNEEFGTMLDDAYRRDFTVNALYYDDSCGEIIDPFTGLEDLENKVVVSIGKAATRFYEDPVRMLRAARLIQSGLVLSSEVKGAILEGSKLLSTVNSSRLYCEFIKMFSYGVQSHCALTLHSLGLLEQFIPRRMFQPLEPWCGVQDISMLVCRMVEEYHSDLTECVVREFNLHPIPGSQKAAKMLVSDLREHLNLDREVALQVKELLHSRYRQQRECA
jgi:poly(A) polymerase